MTQASVPCPDNRPPPRIVELLWCLLPPLAILFAYIPAMFNGFVWDDWFGLVEMPFMTKSEQEWLLVAGNQLFSVNFFRPLTTLLTLIEHRLFEPYPVYFHLTNISLHVCNTLLLTLIARRFRQTPTGNFDLAALAIPLIYGLHPALVEPVAWISGRVDLLVTFFLLLALWFDMAIRRYALRAVLVAIAFLGALLSKEMAAPFPLVLLLWHLALRNNPLRPLPAWWRNSKRAGDLQVYLTLSFAAALYLMARYAILGHLLAGEGPAPGQIDSTWERLLLVGAAYGEILRIASGPLTHQLPLHFLELPLTLSSNHVWLGLATLVVGFVTLLHTRLRISGLGWLWLALLVALLPISNLIPIRTGPGFMAERFMAFPLALASIALVATVAASQTWIARRWSTLGKGRALFIYNAAWILLGMVWLSASTLAVSRQLPRWENDLALWRWSAAALPSSGYARLNLVYALKNNTRYEEAIEVCRDSLGKVEEKYLLDIRGNLGFLYLAVGKPAAAVEELEELLAAYGPTTKSHAQLDVLGNRRTATNLVFVAYINMGNALMELQRDDEALRYFELARASEPEEPSAHYNLGLFQLEHGNPQAALHHFDAALRLYKTTRMGRHNQIYLARGIADTEKMLAKVRQQLGAHHPG